MINVLSIENVLGWSWGIVFRHLRRSLGGKYNISRVYRKTKEDINPEMLSLFPLILCQNVDNVKLIKKFRERLAVRIGGMVISNEKSKSRYDKDLKQVGAVIGTNQELYEIAARVNPNSYLIPNGVDLNMFKPPAGGRPDREFTVGFAGNVWGQGGDYKGWQYYVATTLSLWGEVKKIEHLHNGPNEQRQIKHDEMPEHFYHKIDCLILPSKGEGCSNVVSEALACGTPVLTTKVGYHGEMLRDGKDCLFIKRDVGDIMDKVLMLKRDPQLWDSMSKNGRSFAESHQDINLIAARYDEVFQSVLNNTV